MNSTQLIRDLFHALLDTLAEHEAELGKLDAAAGDGDHGTGMTRGMRAAVEAVDDAPAEMDVPQLFMQAGSAFADKAGGSSGALYGMMLMSIGQKIGAEPTAQSLAQALAAGRDAVAKLGKAKVGDKTMLDTLDPFVNEFSQQLDGGAALVPAWQAALDVAAAGAKSTAEMVAKRGRSAKLAERSLGHADPGAYSVLYLLRAVGAVLARADTAA